MRLALLCLLLVSACVKNEPVGYTPDGRYYYEPSPPPAPRPEAGPAEWQIGEPQIEDAGQAPEVNVPEASKPAPTWI
jgi:hypothetical protein